MKDSSTSNEAPRNNTENTYNSFESIPPCPFKVGDKVRRFAYLVNSNIEMSGAICEIEDVKWSDDDICWYLRLNGNSGYDAAYYELVESTQPQEDKFNELKEAFSKGSIIEVKNYFKDEWREVSNPEWNPNLEYRVKVEEKGIIKYRVSLHYDGIKYYSLLADSPFDEYYTKNESTSFIRWLTDWIEVKV